MSGNSCLIVLLKLPITVNLEDYDAVYELKIIIVRIQYHEILSAKAKTESSLIFSFDLQTWRF